MARPMQKRLLIHTATLKVETRDKWDNPVDPTDIDLTYIRIDSTNKIVQDSKNIERQLSAVIFYDCKNSRPENVVFSKDQQIDYDNDEHRIIDIKPLYDGKKLHHYELEVT